MSLTQCNRFVQGYYYKIKDGVRSHEKTNLLLLAGCLILSGCQKAPIDEMSSANQNITSSMTTGIALDSAPSAALSSETTQPPNTSTEEGSTPVKPQPDVKWDVVEPTAELLQKYDDILSPFVYQKSGEQLTDEEIITGFTALYQSGHTVYYWYLSPDDQLQEEVDYTAIKIVDQQGTEWRPAKRIPTLGEANALVNSVFTDRYRMNALAGKINRFRSYDGQLYINCTSGGIGDPYQPLLETARVLAKTPDAILVEMDIGFNNVPTAEPRPTVFTLIHQGEFWVLDNWL